MSMQGGGEQLKLSTHYAMWQKVVGTEFSEWEEAVGTEYAGLEEAVVIEYLGREKQWYRDVSSPYITSLYIMSPYVISRHFYVLVHFILECVTTNRTPSTMYWLGI